MSVPTIWKESIWKFPLRTTDVQHIAVPRGGKFLTAQLQNGMVTAWARVDCTLPTESVAVRVIGTGMPIRNEDVAGMRYLATVQQGAFVWHVFVPEDA